MSSIKYTDLLPEVLPHMTADPSQPLAEAALRNAVIDFCEQSWVWRHFPDAIDIVAGESTYQIEPAPGSDVVAVLSCKVDSMIITQKTSDSLNTMITDWQTVTGPVKYFTQLDTDNIILAPVPDITIARGMVMVLALQPRRSAVSFPRWIASQYMEELASGALYRLMSMANRPWTDLTAASIHRDRFQQAIAAARSSGVTALGRATTRTKSQH